MLWLLLIAVRSGAVPLQVKYMEPLPQNYLQIRYTLAEPLNTQQVVLQC